MGEAGRAAGRMAAAQERVSRRWSLASGAAWAAALGGLVAVSAAAMIPLSVL